MEFLSFSLELGYVSAGQPADLGDSRLEDATACMWGIWGSHSALLKLRTRRGAGLTAMAPCRAGAAVTSVPGTLQGCHPCSPESQPGHPRPASVAGAANSINTRMMQQNPLEYPGTH